MFSDKAVHAFEYGILALLILRAWIEYPTKRDRAWKNVLSILLLACLYGGSDELHQAFVPGRSCDIRDWAMDALGALLMLLPFAFDRVERRLKKSP